MTPASDPPTPCARVRACACACVRACACACVRACACACVRACVRARVRVRACGRVCVRACVSDALPALQSVGACLQVRAHCTGTGMPAPSHAGRGGLGSTTGGLGGRQCPRGGLQWMGGRCGKLAAALGWAAGRACAGWRLQRVGRRQQCRSLDQRPACQPGRLTTQSSSESSPDESYPSSSSTASLNASPTTRMYSSGWRRGVRRRRAASAARTRASTPSCRC